MAILLQIHLIQFIVRLVVGYLPAFPNIAGSSRWWGWSLSLFDDLLAKFFGGKKFNWISGGPFQFPWFLDFGFGQLGSDFGIPLGFFQLLRELQPFIFQEILFGRQALLDFFKSFCVGFFLGFLLLLKLNFWLLMM